MNPPAEGETVNPPAEEECKKMSKRARWRRNKKKNLLSEAAEVRDSSAEKEEVHDSSAEKEEVRDSSAEKEDVSLCSLIIELLIGDDSIKWVEEDNGTVISIELDGSHSQYALGWFSGDREQPLGF